MAGVSRALLAGDAGFGGVMGHALHQMDTQVSPSITTHLATGFCLPRFLYGTWHFGSCKDTGLGGKEEREEGDGCLLNLHYMYLNDDDFL
jgi:hypothetical protein